MLMASNVQEHSTPGEAVVVVTQGQTGGQEDALCKPGETKQVLDGEADAAGTGQGNTLQCASRTPRRKCSNAASGVNNGAGQSNDSIQLPCDSASVSGTPNDCSQKKVRRSRKQPRPPVVPATPPPSANTGHDQEVTPRPYKKRGRKSKAELLAMAQQQQQQQQNSTPTQDAPLVPEDVEMTPGGRPKRRAAAVAMKYLHSLAEEMVSHPRQAVQTESRPSREQGTGASAGKPGRKRKRKASEQDSDDPSADADFVPEGRVGVESEEEHSEDGSDSSDAEVRVPRARAVQHSERTKPKYSGWAANGLHNNIMGPIWGCAAITKDFREEHCSSWVFPEWIPSTRDWCFLSDSEAEKYLPQEKTSPAFRISREGLNEEPELQRVPRFGSLPAHPERWDMVFFVGGPVWSMEWCPCPDGAVTASQHAAVYSNRGMDDRHKATGVYGEDVLLQVWELGELSYDTRPPAPARLAYALALEDGCVWDMKWCPSGSWELPTTSRKSPHMPRLGLLAAAFSSGKIGIYSLPHPDSLLAFRKTQITGEVNQSQVICRVQSVAFLKLGSVQADHGAQSGQCFSLDWLPVKPHNILAAGFYDGSVSLWNLNTKSVLQRVRSSGAQVVLYPYHTFMAHDNIVRVLCWCKASSDLIVTAGDDRKVRLWDLRKTYEPVNSFKRYLTTEVVWPLHWSGVCTVQESSYATYGQHGMHYIDSGYLGFKPFFAAPRKGTIWSMSYSDWLNTTVLGDSVGEMIMVLLPDLSVNPASQKRTADRRFPVYRAEVVPLGSSSDAEEENIRSEERTKEESSEASNGPVGESQTYSEVVKKYYLHFHDLDLRTFKNVYQRASVKHMLATEVKGLLPLDKMPLEALHKVRLNPNLGGQSWALSAGHAGLVRAHCLRTMHSPIIHKMAQESQAQFAAMFLSQGPSETTATTVRHSTENVLELL